jgi:cytochrome c
VSAPRYSLPACLRRCPGRRWVVAALLVAGGCSKMSGHDADRIVDDGDPGRGRNAIAAYGCGSCHVIPGVRGADGMVGPSLEHWAERRIIAGEVPNDPARLITWLTVPQSIEPGTAMPNMGVTDGQARDIAAYLYTLH